MDLTDKITVHDGTIKNSFSMLIAGPRKSGKTVFVKNFLLSNLIYPPLKKIMWVYAAYQKYIFNDLYLGNRIEFVNDLPSISEMNDCCVILDDFVIEAVSNKDVLKLFLAGKHNGNSILLISQNLYFPGKNSKSISNNSDYIVLTKNFKGIDQIKTLATQLKYNFHGKASFLMDAYEHATESQRYGHLFIVCEPETSRNIRVCGNIFSNLPEIIVYQPKNL